MVYDYMESHSGMMLMGKWKNSEKNLSHVTLPTTNPTRTDLDLRGKGLVTNSQSYGTAYDVYKFPTFCADTLESLVMPLNFSF
jgi:hypothetical protein